MSSSSSGSGGSMGSKVAVGLSGGVDSSVAIALLQRQGYDVAGVTLWLMKGNNFLSRRRFNQGNLDRRTSYIISYINFFVPLSAR